MMEKLSLSRLHALALLEYGEERGLSEFYQQVSALVLSGRPTVENAPEGLREFLLEIPQDEVEHTLQAFLVMAKRRMDQLPVEIISAVPLTEAQLQKLEERLIRLVKKRLDIKTTVDPSLLGGVRIIVDNTVIDESIKRKLLDMKQNLYKISDKMESDIVKIGASITDEVSSFLFVPHTDELGRVIQSGDGIVRVIGLKSAMSGELLQFEDGTTGIAMNLEEDNIGVVLLGSGAEIHTGDFVTRTNRVASVPVGDALLGRVVNALGQPIDQKDLVMMWDFKPIERVAPGVLARRKVDVPLQTGIKAIDVMVPIGRGQRQLIIGDRQTGKTAIVLDTIINQKNEDVFCVYVAIGQKNSTVAAIVNTLSAHDALRYTTVVVAGASESSSLQYLAPFSGCAIAEYWMEQGKDVLIVFDDLSKHAVAYRTMSLLLRRPSGREAYPGDIFYLHARLLERAGRLTEKLGGGSITALPIVETQGGDMSAYIPTNIISITDGQIYLETAAFNAGVRPAINPGLSVSRVGGAAQVKAMKKLAAPIRIELAQYRELAAFAQFSSDLDQDTRDRLRHGERIVETLKQPQYKPMPLEHEILVLFTITNHCLDDIKLEDILDFEQRMAGYFDLWHADMMDEIRSLQEISPELEKQLLEAIEQFKANYLA